MKKLTLLMAGLWLCLGLQAQEETFKIIHGPYLQQVGETEATIMWVTNHDAASWVELAPDDGSNFYAEARPQYYQTQSGRRAVGRVHAVKVTGLKPATTYRYRIYSQHVTRLEDYYMEFGRTDATAAFQRPLETFTTFDNSRPSIRFTVVNDIHERNDVLTEALGDVQTRKPDLVFFNGDMCSTLRSEEQLFGSFMDRSIELFAKTTPMFYARGNHETRGSFAHQFLNYFPTPTGETYYTFRCGPVFFVMLDAGEDKPDNDIEYFGMADYDRFRRKQVEWLKKVVESPEFKEAPYRIAIIHLPTVEVTNHAGVEVRELFAPILNKAGIDVMLGGHTHRHLYVPAGERECDYPVLINKAEEALDVDVDMQKIRIQVRDPQQKVVKTLEFPRK